MKHTVNNNRPWIDKVETLTIEVDCTEIVKATVDEVAYATGLEYEQGIEVIQTEPLRIVGGAWHRHTGNGWVYQPVIDEDAEPNVKNGKEKV